MSAYRGDGSIGREAYALRAEKMLTWKAIGTAVGTSASSASICARAHALREGLAWPLSRPAACSARWTKAFTCGLCGSEGRRRSGDVNRANRDGRNLYCSRRCSAQARTKYTAEQARQRKLEYDRARYADPETREHVKAVSRASYQRHAKEIYRRHRAKLEANPDLMAKCRAAQARCQSSPAWKEHKREYDREWRAKRRYGDLWEAHLLLLELEDSIEERVPDRTQIYAARGTLNKRQARKRAWLRTNAKS